MSEIEQEHRQVQDVHFSDTSSLPALTTIDGPLPGGKRLTEPIIIQIQCEDGEVLVSEPHFFMHAVGPTLPEAIGEFKRIIADELDQLTHDEKILGPRLQRHLHYLRSIIKAA